MLCKSRASTDSSGCRPANDFTLATVEDSKTAGSCGSLSSPVGTFLFKLSSFSTFFNDAFSIDSKGLSLLTSSTPLTMSVTGSKRLSLTEASSVCWLSTPTSFLYTSSVAEESACLLSISASILCASVSTVGSGYFLALASSLSASFSDKDSELDSFPQSHPRPTANERTPTIGSMIGLASPASINIPTSRASICPFFVALIAALVYRVFRVASMLFLFVVLGSLEVACIWTSSPITIPTP
mmetsp:Transcript_12265/g.18991  ORF Transcript_12265/g.18991 Transcript_12265/m.18991 type:complete len:241 (-) Transcript_12265:267-989(-)